MNSSIPTSQLVRESPEGSDPPPGFSTTFLISNWPDLLFSNSEGLMIREGKVSLWISAFTLFTSILPEAEKNLSVFDSSELSFSELS
jgi:hypothetical protein